MLRMGKTATFWFGILGASFFIVPTILGGFQFHNYSQIHQFISENYATGTPYGRYIRFLGYIPSGIFIAFFSFSAMKLIPRSSLTKTSLIGFGVLYGIGTIISGIFPCDFGCNKEFINPSVSQLIHNVFGALIYIFVPFCLVLFGVGSRTWSHGKTISTLSIICGLVSFVFSMLLLSNPIGNYIGLYQRFTEGSILFWLINFAFYIKNHAQI